MWGVVFPWIPALIIAGVVFLTDRVMGMICIQKQVAGFVWSPYVFLNTRGRPVDQVAIRGVWVTAIRKSGLPFRRMYETRTPLHPGHWLLVNRRSGWPEP